MTRKWNVVVGIFPSEEAFRNDQPLRVVDVLVEHSERHDAMSVAERRVRETMGGGDGEYQVWATDATEESEFGSR